METKPEKGQLLVFVNGKNRSWAEDETKAIRAILNKPPTTVCRILKNLLISGWHTVDKSNCSCKKL